MMHSNFFICKAPSASYPELVLGPPGGGEYTPVCLQSSPPGTVVFSRRSHRFPTALFRDLKACRFDIRNQLFQTHFRPWPLWNDSLASPAQSHNARTSFNDYPRKTAQRLAIRFSRRVAGSSMPLYPSLTLVAHEDCFSDAGPSWTFFNAGAPLRRKGSPGSGR